MNTALIGTRSPETDVPSITHDTAGSNARARVVPRGLTWSPWHGQHRPATATEERRLVARLADLAEESGTPTADWTRRDVTAVVNALRCGLDADELLRRGPGLVPGRLVAAHLAVERRRRDAERAWRRLVADPTPATFDAGASAIATLLPVVVRRLRDQVRHGPSHLAAAVDHAALEVERVDRAARSVEDWMSVVDGEDAVRLGGLLLDADEPGLWDHDHFLAPRVGALVSTRLASVLGERTVAI